MTDSRFEATNWTRIPTRYASEDQGRHGKHWASVPERLLWVFPLLRTEVGVGRDTNGTHLWFVRTEDGPWQAYQVTPRQWAMRRSHMLALQQKGLVASVTV